MTCFSLGSTGAVFAAALRTVSCAEACAAAAGTSAVLPLRTLAVPRNVAPKRAAAAIKARHRDRRGLHPAALEGMTAAFADVDVCFEPEIVACPISPNQTGFAFPVPKPAKL
jgi:hypothetical protein